ncbi:response regulator [Oceanicoccus sp. KOV_DT_Chl]|uniref:response regulator n=1 Tax=Oceanicoccus sp. KOV_DT_Chl TaxID=1904639 RepID=UPI000C7A102E|nr:response regulator [Oceanicoccus sp. KOV_DT_Chl]
MTKNETTTGKILIVEDERKLATLMQDYLMQAGFNTHIIDHGDKVIDWLTQHQADTILLDLMLPGKDGLTLCKEIRAFSNTPILIITAKVDEIDRLLGLELGADDYICKPFSPREVVARVKAILRRSQPSTQLANAEFSLDPDRVIARFQQHTIEFTQVEFQLLKLLYNTPGKIFSRNQLMDNIYSDHRIVSDRTIDSHIKKLRKKLHLQFPHYEFVHSVYGAGYKFDLLKKSSSPI